MTLTFWKRSALAAGLLFFAPALAQQPAPRQPQAAPKAKETKETKERSSPLAGFGANGKEPIKIDSDRLDVFDRDGRAVFTGNVVAVQGDSTIRCSIMTVFYEQNRAQAQAGGQPRQPSSSPGSNDNSIKKIDCQGPVTVVSKTQTATGDNAVYDKAGNKVVITGNVALADGPNMMRGERIVYDLDTGVANVDPKAGERVKALITPGSGSENGPKADSSKADPSPKPKADPSKADSAPKPAPRPASARAN
jgi:lipopolysaccharide export system protein LptA